MLPSLIRWTNTSTWKYVAEKYNLIMNHTVGEVNSNARDDVHFSLQSFMLTIQPIARGVEKFDCFHPNSMSRTAMAVNLWNDMVGDTKSTVFKYDVIPIIPSSYSVLK